MELLEQCQKWHEDDEYQKIVDTLEAIPEEERTPEVDSELARAYNNLAEGEDKELLKKAIALLKPHEEYFEGDYYWNFRMGYAYYFLVQEGVARRYFRQALEALPGDEDTQQFIDWCDKSLSLPLFEESFRERTEAAWKAFAENEAELRRFMDEDKKHKKGDELVAKCNNILSIAFDDVSFELGINGEKHELILTPEGDKVKLFELLYFRRHAPESVLENWSILVGRRPMENFDLRLDDRIINGDDVQVWIEQEENGDIGLSAYCEKLSEVPEEEEDKVWWMLTTLTDSVLGEITHMKYVDSFDVLDAPKEEPPVLLSELPEKLKGMVMELSVDAEAFLESYTGYSCKPDENPEADWRMDVIAGSTNCVPLINDYLNGDSCNMDMLHADGAAAGFFCYPLDGFTGDDRSQQIFDFRDSLEEALIEECGDDITLIGGATGIYYGYVDFIAWDLRAVLGVAERFFDDTDLPWAGFHVFRRDAVTIPLKEETAELPEDLDCIPYKPENADAFYKQIEQWNDEDEYTLSIKALETISPDLWDYRAAYAMARALENYAIIGDHNEGTPTYKGDNALNRAIEVLEEVREEGRDKAEWNMRMAYAYQYLYGQEEKAIPYAQRWAELDPDDENALWVINECKKEIADRSKEESESGEGNERNPKGTFAGFVLLSKGKWDKEQFIRDMKEKWDITVEDDEDGKDDTFVFEVGDMLAAVSLMNYPIPNGEAEINAENNYMWQGAVEAAKQHCAHIMVAVMGKEQDLLERGKLYSKIVAACCRQKYATGVYTSGVVFEPRFYEDFADMMKEDELPVFNWIWFGLYRSEGGMNAYTYGMEVFGKDEMEVLNADAEPEELRDFLADIVSYVLNEDAELLDGETIGFSAEDKHTITRSMGVSLPEEQMTLKISYESIGGSGEDS